MLLFAWERPVHGVQRTPTYSRSSRRTRPTQAQQQNAALYNTLVVCADIPGVTADIRSDCIPHMCTTHIHMCGAGGLTGSEGAQMGGSH